MKILILGYSNIVRKRVLSILKEKKITIFIASKSYKQKIPGIKKQYKSYENALKKSKPKFKADSVAWYAYNYLRNKDKKI